MGRAGFDVPKRDDIKIVYVPVPAVRIRAHDDFTGALADWKAGKRKLLVDPKPRTSGESCVTQGVIFPPAQVWPVVGEEGWSLCEFDSRTFHHFPDRMDQSSAGRLRWGSPRGGPRESAGAGVSPHKGPSGRP